MIMFNRIAAIAAACLITATISADAKRRDGNRHRAVKTALIIYVLAEDDCPHWLKGVKLSKVVRDTSSQRLACIYEHDH